MSERRIAALAAALGAWLAGPGRVAACEGPAPGAASAGTLKLPDMPASIRGLSDAASVNVFSAQLAYQIPIDLPAGPAGFGPALALQYSGELGNGPLGIGWSLGGISIRRSLRLGVPAYDDSDELDLIGIGPGGRLVRDPQIDGRYWVEGQGHTIRVDRKGAHFEVLDGNGTHFFLGVDGEGIEGAEGKTLGWHAQWIVSVLGQQIQLRYQHDRNQLYLQRIVWGPGTPFSLAIDYQSRPDVTTSYRSGYQVDTALLAAHLTVSSFGQVLRVYDLSYDQTTYPVSRLVRVSMRGRGGRSGLPDLTFGYVHQDAPQVVQLGNVGGWVLNTRGVTLLDVDGDGMSDLARLELGNHEYRKNLNGQFADPRPLTGAADVDLQASTLMDVDGDARADLVHIVDDTWRVARLVGEQWQPAGTWSGTHLLPIHAPDAVLADLNGDGRTDVIQGSASGLTINFGRDGGMSPDVTAPRIQTDAEIEPGNANLRFVDMNGDGLADAVWLTDAWMKVFLGRGDGRFVPTAVVQYPWLASGENPVVNLTDLFLADLDRDGLVDLVRFTAGHVLWYQGLPQLHFATSARSVSRPEAVDADAVVTIADVNGNGSADMVWSSPRGMWALDLAGRGSAGMLESIDNGLGKVTTVSYSASAVMSVEADQSGVPWDRKLPLSVPVPVSLEIDPGAGPLRTVRFGVRDGFWDGVERRFGGFLEGHQVTVAGTNADLKFEETHFDAGLGSDRVLRGKPRMARILDGDGRLISVTVTDWQARVVAGLPDSPLLRKAAPAEITATSYERTPVGLQTQTTFQYDDEARATIEIHAGLATAGDERIVHRLFASDDRTWVRDRVYFEEVTDGTGVLASRQQSYFGDPAGAVLPLGTVGQGLARQTDAFLAEEARWITQTATNYDSCGNPSSVYENGVLRAIGFDAACLHPTSETVSPGGGGGLLSWSMLWDNVIGQPTFLTDPNGDVTGVVYDDLARPLAISINAAPPHALFIYDWTPPRPRTTSCSWDRSLTSLPPQGQGCPGGAGWRTVVAVANGAGEDLYASTPLGDGTFIISGWKERDERGQVVLQAEPFTAAVPLPDARPPSNVRLTTFHHDVMGRLDLETLANGARKSITYEPFKQTVSTDELAPVVSQLDGLGRVAATSRQVETGLETVAATYDAADRITKFSLQGGAVEHVFRYDTLGRLAYASDPDTGERQLTYDDRNFLVDHVNGVGQHVFFSYDDAGRLTRRGETANPDPQTDYTFVYDNVTSALSGDCHVLGRLASVTELAGEAHLCYDVFGRQNGIGRIIVAAEGPKSASDISELSPSGLLLEARSDDLFAVGYKYDAAGRAICMRTPPADDPAKCRTLPGTASDDYWVADEIDAAGRVRREHYGNGAAQSYDHDALGLVSYARLDQPGAAAASDLFEILVTRNSYGAPIIVDDRDGGHLDHTARYTYDGAGRLTDATMGASASQQYAFTYRYDALQNMTLRQVFFGGVAKDIGALAGQYRYGERGYGPRQLTSIAPEDAP